MNKESIGQRIRALRRSKKLTQAQLAKIAGVSSPAVTEWEKDSYLPKASSLEAMAKTFGVTTEYLLEGRENPSSNNSSSNSVGFGSSNISPVKARMAPVLSWVQAGTLTNVQAIDASDIDEWLPLPDDECSSCYFLKVRGVSNYPSFLEGDYIVVNPDVSYSDMQSGDIIVVRRGDEATFKKLVIEPDDTRYLQAINPDFKPNVIELNEDFEFVGQVVDCVRYVYKAKPRIRKS